MEFSVHSSSPTNVSDVYRDSGQLVATKGQYRCTWPQVDGDGNISTTLPSPCTLFYNFSQRFGVCLSIPIQNPNDKRMEIRAGTQCASVNDFAPRVRTSRLDANALLTTPARYSPPIFLDISLESKWRYDRDVDLEGAPREARRWISF